MQTKKDTEFVSGMEVRSQWNGAGQSTASFDLAEVGCNGKSA